MSSILTCASNQSPATGRGFAVNYRDPVRGDVHESLSLAMAYPFERAEPAAALPAYHGQRGSAGYYWSARLSDHVGYRNWLERDTAMVLDHDAQVHVFASRPFRLFWAGQNRARAYCPAFFARRVDGTAVVIDCRSRSDAVLSATRDACAFAQWDHLLVTGHDPVWIENLRWLAGYRQPRHHRAAVADALVAAFAEPGPLVATVAAVGEPIAVLPVLYHLLWNRQLHADLTVRLDGVSIVSVPR